MKIKKILISIVLIFSITNVIAQTYLMPTSGYQEIHTDSGVLYDDGGATGNYSTRVNSTMTIYPATPGAYVCLRGAIDLEDYLFSSIRVYDGDTNSTWELWSNSWYGSYSDLNVLSNTGALTIRFNVDSESPKPGFHFNIAAPTKKATNIIPSISNNNSAVNFTWDGTTSEYWIAELHFEGQSWIKTTSSNSITFDSLPYSCCHYYYLIYTPSDSSNLPCFHHDHFYLPPTYSISNIRYDRRCDTLEVWWDASDTSITWRVDYDNFVFLSQGGAGFQHNQNAFAFSDTNHIVLHIPKYTANYLYNYDVYGSYDQFTIFGSIDGSRYCPLLGEVIEPICCCPRAENLYISDLDPYSATVSWDADTIADGWIVEYNNSVYPDDSISFITVATNFISLTNLSPASKYDVRVHSLCDSLVSKCSSKINVITNIGGLDNCMTFTNLRDTNFTPYTGTYANPNQEFGLIDFGYEDQRSRHTVHYDTTEFDPRTDSLLHTVPPGEEASVRLGNWLPGAEGESFTYAYEVDTNVFNLMYLRYAVVMENPGHTIENQPRFTLEILNENDSVIDPVCGFADFFASDSLGWNTVSNSIAIWKDWTLVGFDITPYHGQRIYVRLTTKDCDEGGHYGYAYYHLTCGSKNLISTKCGYVDSNTFIAPIGFDYNWYSSNDTTLTLSTERILDAVVDSTANYHCLVSSTENPSCNFLYTAYGGYRYPLSQFDYEYDWSPCSYTVRFNNLSTISPDGIRPAGTNETCESTIWVFPDGDTIRSTNAIKTFSDTSQVRVQLISGIANDACISILDTVLELNKPYPPLNIIGDTSICYTNNTILSLNYGNGRYLWSNGGTLDNIEVTPLFDTRYYVEVTDSLGCYNIDSIDVAVHPMDTVVFEGEICENEIYNLNGFNENTEGIYVQKLTSIWGCDSIVYLDLKINPTYLFDTIDEVICKNNPYTEHGLNVDSTGVYVAHLQTIYGCDSIYIVRIEANPVYYDTIRADIYKGNTYNQHGFNENTTGVYNLDLQTELGCDSIIYLDLQVDNILFPNVVTPNGDGINDVFTINNLVEQDAFPENELVIFNRQGKIIYQKSNIKHKVDFWDPALTKSPTGTYFYRFKGKRHDKTIDMTSTVEVLR